MHKRVAIDHIARRGGKRVARYFAKRRHPLDQGIHRGGQDARTFQRGARTGKPRENHDPPRRNRGVGRYPVIGLAIPGGKIEELDVRRGECQRLAEGAGALAIARDMDERDSPAFRVFRKRAGEIRGTKSVESIGHGGERERAALDEFGGHTFEISHDTRSIRKLFAERRASNRNASEIYGWIGPGWLWKARIFRNTGVSYKLGISASPVSQLNTSRSCASSKRS